MRALSNIMDYIRNKGSNTMGNRRTNDLDGDSYHFNNNDNDSGDDASPSTKLERRRRIEDLFEEKRLRDELREFDLA